MDWKLSHSCLAGTKDAGGVGDSRHTLRSTWRKRSGFVLWRNLTFLFHCFQGFSAQSSRIRSLVPPRSLRFCAWCLAPSQGACLSVFYFGVFTQNVLFWACLFWEDWRQVLLKIIDQILSHVRSLFWSQQMSRHFEVRGKYKKKRLFNYLVLGFFVEMLKNLYTCVCMLCT